MQNGLIGTVAFASRPGDSERIDDSFVRLFHFCAINMDIYIAPTGGPESVSCVSSGSTSLRVSWHPPAVDARGGLITHYTLQYTRRDVDPLLPTQDAYLRVQVSNLSGFPHKIFFHALLPHQ